MKLFSIALLNFKSAMNQTHIPDKGLEDSSLENNLTGIKKKKLLPLVFGKIPW